MPARKAAPDYKHLRSRLVDFARGQDELRRHVREFHTNGPSSLSDDALARRVGSTGQTIRGFLAGTASITSQKALPVLGDLVGQGRLARQIAGLSADIPDRYYALGIRSSEAIELVFDLLETHGDHRDHSHATFAAAFGPLSGQVAGVLRMSGDSLILLEDEDCRQEIMEILLADDFPQRLAEAHAKQVAVMHQLAAELRGLVEPLKERRYGEYQRVAKALGFSRGALHSALKGESSEANVRQMIAKARQLLRSMPQKLTKAELAAELEQYVVPLKEKHREYGKVAAVLGVSYSGLNAARKGEAGERTYAKLIERARKLVSAATEVPADVRPKPVGQLVPTKGKLAAELQDHCGVLHERYGQQKLVAKALGRNRDTLRKALKGEAGMSTMQDMVQRARQLVGSEPATAPQPPAEPDALQPDVPAALAAVAGITSEAGVPFVLTEDCFTELEGVPVLALRDALVRSIRTTRLLLNVGAQLKDKVARELLREEVGKEVEELELAQRQFTFAHPNRLLGVYQGQRATFGKRNDQSGKSNRKGGRR